MEHYYLEEDDKMKDYIHTHQTDTRSWKEKVNYVVSFGGWGESVGKRMCTEKMEELRRNYFKTEGLK